MGWMVSMGVGCAIPRDDLTDLGMPPLSSILPDGAPAAPLGTSGITLPADFAGRIVDSGDA